MHTTIWESCKHRFPIGCRLHMDVSHSNCFFTHLVVPDFEDTACATMADTWQRSVGEELYVIVLDHFDENHTIEVRPHPEPTE